METDVVSCGQPHDRGFLFGLIALGPILPIALNMHQQQYNSYLIRIWQDDIKNDAGATLGRQGEVFHIQTGRLWLVDDAKLLSDLLEDLMTKREPLDRKED